MLPSMLPRCSQAHFRTCSQVHSPDARPFDYMLPCMLLGAQSRDLLSCRRQALGGGWQEAGGSGRNHDVGRYHSLNLIVVQPLRQDLTMPHGHSVVNCRLTFCRKGRQLDHGERRSPTQIFLRNQLPASHRFWVYVCQFCPGLMVMMAMVMMAMVMMAMVMMAMVMMVMVMMAMVMMAMVMVSVMVIIVPDALGQEGWLRQRQHQSFHRLRVFH